MAIQGITSHYKENTKMMHYLSEEQCEQMINAAFQLLDTTGIKINDADVEKMFTDKGATKNANGALNIPREIIIDCIKTAPSETFLYDRFGKEKLHVGGTDSYFGLGPTNPYTNDPYTGERRDSKRQDVANAAIVADGCENIDYLMGLAQISDENPAISDVLECYEMLTNSTKPAIVWGINDQGLEDQVKMADAIAGGHDRLVEKPFIALFPGCPDTPLQINSREAKSLIYCADTGLPIIWMGGGQTGTVTPVSLPASAAISLVEMLVGLAIAQMAHPGCPVVVGFGGLTVDMRSMASCYGTPEHCIVEMMSSDIFSYLGLPTIGTAGVTDSKLPDTQSAIEVSMNSFCTYMTGANLIHDVGFIDSALSGSVEQIVLCDEIIGYIRRIARPFEINDETLLFDLIDEVGPGGSYLTEDHTLENFKEEVWFGNLTDHNSYKNWSVDKKDFSARLHERTIDILENHKPEPLPEDVLAKLNDILKSAEARVAK